MLNGVEAGRHITEGIFQYYVGQTTAKLLFQLPTAIKKASCEKGCGCDYHALKCN